MRSVGLRSISSDNAVTHQQSWRRIRLEASNGSNRYGFASENGFLRKLDADISFWRVEIFLKYCIFRLWTVGHETVLSVPPTSLTDWKFPINDIFMHIWAMFIQVNLLLCIKMFLYTNFKTCIASTVKCPQYSSVGLFISFSALNNINECLICKLIILLAVAGFEDW